MAKKISRRRLLGDATKVAGAGLLLGGCKESKPESKAAATSATSAAPTAPTAAPTTAATTASTATPAASPHSVVQVEHRAVVSKKRKVDPDAVSEMLRQGATRLLGGPEPFKRLFSPTDKVGLKINCLGRKLLHTHRELVQAVARELQAVGIPPHNIVVWDRFGGQMQSCGYQIKDEPKAVRYLATEPRGRKGRFDSQAKYVKDNAASRISSLFTTECNKHINLAILKDHGLSGVTLCLKNIAYGVCDNNSRFHGRAKIHNFIADFCARDDVKKKFVLHVIDGLEGCFNGGPKPGPSQLFRPQTLWLGTDPVALDNVGAKVIEAERKKRKLPSLKAVGRSPEHIALAAKRGVGKVEGELVKVTL